MSAEEAAGLLRSRRVDEAQAAALVSIATSLEALTTLAAHAVTIQRETAPAILERNLRERYYAEQNDDLPGDPAELFEYFGLLAPERHIEPVKLDPEGPL